MEKEVFFDRIVESLLKQRVYFSNLKVDCAVIPGLLLSNVNVLSSFATNELGILVTTEFWQVFSRAHEFFKNRHSFSDAEHIAFNNLLKTYGSCDESKLLCDLDALKHNQLEVDTNVWIVENIISPLLGEGGQCLLNNIHGAAVKKLQQNGVGKRLIVVKQLGIGHMTAWYGEPDVLVEPSQQVISDGQCAIVGSSKVTRPGESKMDVEDDDTDDGGDSPGNNVMITIEGLHCSQSVATAISFAFTYSERHGDLGSLIPTLQISPDNFVVFLYDSVNDYLLGAMFSWTKLSLIYLWVVLHYRLFQRSTFSVDDIACSGYRSESDRKGGFTKLNNFMYKANIHQHSKEHVIDMRFHLRATTQ